MPCLSPTFFFKRFLYMNKDLISMLDLQGLFIFFYFKVTFNEYCTRIQNPSLTYTILMMSISKPASRSTYIIDVCRAMYKTMYAANTIVMWTYSTCQPHLYLKACLRRTKSVYRDVCWRMYDACLTKVKYTLRRKNVPLTYSRRVSVVPRTIIRALSVSGTCNKEGVSSTLQIGV